VNSRVGFGLLKYYNMKFGADLFAQPAQRCVNPKSAQNRGSGLEGNLNWRHPAYGLAIDVKELHGIHVVLSLICPIIPNALQSIVGANSSLIPP
jgi:hypothetical protein